MIVGGFNLEEQEHCIPLIRNIIYNAYYHIIRIDNNDMFKLKDSTVLLSY